MNKQVADGALKLTRRGRVVLLLLVAFVLGGMAIVVPGLLSSATAEAPSEPAQVEVVTIERGQTLWHVASGITEPGDDVRDSVAVISDLNNLVTVDVQVGQQLLVPVA